MDINSSEKNMIPPKLKLPIKYLLILLLIILSGVYLLFFRKFSFYSFFSFKQKVPGSSQGVKVQLNKFSGYEEYSEFFNQSNNLNTAFFQPPGALSETGALNNKEVSQDNIAAFGRELLPMQNKVSKTNVQVYGIDEPDIVKTDGKNIYLSQNKQIIYEIAPDFRVSQPAYPSKVPAISSNAKIIQAFPIDEIQIKHQFSADGEFLLNNGILLVLSTNKLTAFDVTEGKNPEIIWQKDFDTRSVIISSRLYQNKVYLVSRIAPDTSNCISPFITGDKPMGISCTEIYRPDMPVPAESIFTVVKIDLKSGEIEEKVALTGNSQSSIFYMSENNLFLTYSYFEDYLALITGFYEKEANDLISKEAFEKIKRLSSLDISQQSKLMELSQILEKYRLSLNEDDILKIENETQDRLNSYLSKNIRKLESTAIISFNIDTLKINSQGTVPGIPLNQFSIDQFNGNLRIATTIGSTFSTNSVVNDVYVLDDKLHIIGKIENLGEGETIYSVRFINDLGYLVTFKQTDPFYILDLKDSKNPKKVGELKIPGYSSYLHPLTNNLILGIGKENQKIKLSLFDVSDSKNPVEVDKFQLDEYWTEVESNHRAFLQDDANGVFYIPGGRGGYIFSYRQNKLLLKKAISQIGAKRAIFINDYFYLLGEDNMAVLDRNSWEKVKTLRLN